MTGLGYTLPAVLAVIAVFALEFGVLHTGLLRRPAYWISMVIVFAFQIPVDGWLTKLSAPIVIYHSDQMLGVRLPWDVPVEDYGFGFAMVTLTILMWRWLLGRPSRVKDRMASQSAPMVQSGTIMPAATR